MDNKHAQSIAENLRQKVAVLKMQNQSLIMSEVPGFYPTIVVAGLLKGETIDEYFTLDNMESAQRCAEFTHKLSQASKTLLPPMGEPTPLLGGVA